MGSRDIAKELANRLPDKEFVTQRDLIRAGIFRSYGAIQEALNRGSFTFLKVSPGRTLISRQSIVDHLYRSAEASKKK